jgi:hypothetical protein
MGSEARRGATIRLTDDGRTLRHVPIGDIILHTELRVATEHNVRSFRCPCKECKGGRRKNIQVIRQHHATYGRDPFLCKSLLGGDPPEGYPPGGIWVEDICCDNDVIEDIPSDTPRVHLDVDNDGVDDQETPPLLDEFHEVERQVLEALGRGDALHEEAEHEGGLHVEDGEDIEIEDELDGLYTEATTALYPGSKTSVVSATIIIMNMCSVFRVSNTFTDELFRFLSGDLLPVHNKLPKTHYAARKSIRRLGLNYASIHACPNGCILYDEEYATHDTCPKCMQRRWLDGSNNIPARVIRHFPLIPRLKRMWRSSEIARLLTGHTKHVSSDDVMRSVVDSPAWKHINNDVAFGNFGCDDRNMRLALALDGVNPFKLNNTNWSTWPVLILIYNFEPWLVTKKFFISLCILISGKKSPTSSNIDVFIRPLLKELQELWHGVHALDFSQPQGNRAFTLRAILMWTISDFPAYGLISGLTCKGYKGCPCCGPNTDARMAKTGDMLPNRSIRGTKIVYGGIRRYLPRHHPYRRNRRFNGLEEDRLRPKPLSGEDIIRYAAWRESYLQLGGRENGPGDPVHVTGVKRLSALFELDYWQVMHVYSLMFVHPIHDDVELDTVTSAFVFLL